MYPILQGTHGPHMGEGEFRADQVFVNSGTRYSEEVLEDPCVVGSLMT